MSSDYFEQTFFSRQTSPALGFAAKRRSQCFASETENSSEAELYNWTYSTSTPERKNEESRDRGGLTPIIIRAESDIPPVPMESPPPTGICANDCQGTCREGITYV